MRRFSLLIVLAAGLACITSGVMAQAWQEEPEETARSARHQPQPDDRFCIQQTGTRVTATRNVRSRNEQKQCVDSGARVYTREEIERSDSADLRDAVRRLDAQRR